ncbi:mannose-1-phosphate guanylyltransferase [Candidatus Shapirobacteria bacterium]|nr:mannose-1-phosphate guanylyltransferase [Candidatus Shapirobacteria bacterium]
MSSYILIICGGGGTRLWPLSRRKSPKQFLPLFGKKNLLAQTVERAQKVVSPSRIFFVAGQEYAGDILKSAPQVPPQNLIIEPDKKHTAAAIILGNAKIAQKDPQAIITNLWSDQLVENNQNFEKDVKKAMDASGQKKALVAIGIKPTFPHTGFGYIETGRKVAPQLFEVKQFQEKPDRRRAIKFLEAGNFYWNLGTYTWPATVFFDELKKTHPPLFASFKKIQKASGKENEWEKIKKIYEEITPISIDEAVAEKTKNMLMLAATFDWYDVGDWQAVWEKSPKDKDGNAVLPAKGGKVVLWKVKNSLFFSKEKLIAAAGVEDLIVVETKDVILVCHKEKSQEVKDLLEEVKKQDPRYAE